MRICIPMLLIISFAVSACATEEQAQQAEHAKSSPAEVSARDIRDILQENPDIILNVLKQHPEIVFELAQAGLGVKQEKARQEKIQHDLENPKTSTLDPLRPVRGPEDAPITIVEFSDFQCPYCSRAAKTVEELMHNYPETLKLVFKHYPLEGHPHAGVAARFFEAAALQDPEKAWKLHDAMFYNQQELDEGGESWIASQAKEIGLDMDKLAADLNSPEIDAILASDMAEIERLNIRGTPYFLVGGVAISGAAPLNEFEDVVAKVQAYRSREKAEEPDAPDAAVPELEGAAAQDADSCVDCVSKD